MPHCQICNFCETTGTPSEYNTDLFYHNNKVKYYPELGGDFCWQCVTDIRLNMNTYADEQEEKERAEKEFDFREHLRKPDADDCDEDTEKPPALSEV